MFKGSLRVPGSFCFQTFEGGDGIGWGSVFLRAVMTRQAT